MARRPLALGLIALGILLLIFGVGYAIYSQAVAHPGVPPFPEQMAGLSIAQKMTGLPAVEEINNLHGKEFQLTSGAVARYGANGQVTLWVSGVPLSQMASRILYAMRDKIAEGRSPFLPLEERKIGKRTIYVLDGMGQRHFYYQSKNLVIWLAADHELAELSLDHMLEFYP